MNIYALLLFVKAKGTVISLFACINLILRHPIAVSGETATCSQVVAERANTVGLLLEFFRISVTAAEIAERKYFDRVPKFLFQSRG